MKPLTLPDLRRPLALWALWIGTALLQACACGCQAPEQHALESPREHCLEMTGSKQQACLAALAPASGAPKTPAR